MYYVEDSVTGEMSRVNVMDVRCIEPGMIGNLVPTTEARYRVDRGKHAGREFIGFWRYGHLYECKWIVTSAAPRG